MREYRGKCKDNGEWVHGYYVYQSSTDTHYILTEEVYREPVYNKTYFAYHEVDPKTAGQYVNYYGLEFYDKDIISIACDCDSEYGCFHPDGKYIVVWDEKAAGYALKSLRNGRMYSLDEFGVENMYVIGNAYDNPDLLGEVRE